jgi:hypothetical protein
MHSAGLAIPPRFVQRRAQEGFRRHPTSSSPRGRQKPASVSSMATADKPLRRGLSAMATLLSWESSAPRGGKESIHPAVSSVKWLMCQRLTQWLVRTRFSSTRQVFS